MRVVDWWSTGFEIVRLGSKNRRDLWPMYCAKRDDKGESLRQVKNCLAFEFLSCRYVYCILFMYIVHINVRDTHIVLSNPQHPMCNQVF